MALSIIPNNMQASLTSTQLPVGTVVQTIFGPEFHPEVTTSSTSYVVVSNSLATSITPTSASNKIIVTCTIPNLMLWRSGSNDARVQLGISSDNGSTFIRETNNRIYDYGASGLQMHYTANIIGIHSPSSISQQTYNLYYHIDAGNARVNDDQGASNEGVSGTAGACFTQFILQEIAQ